MPTAIAAQPPEAVHRAAEKLTNEVQTAIGLVVAGLGYALVPGSVQALDRAGVVYAPLSDVDVTTPIIMNRRRDDDSELTSFIRAIVCALPTTTLGKS